MTASYGSVCLASTALRSASPSTNLAHAAVACTVYGFLIYLWFRDAPSSLERLLAIVLFVLWVGLIGSARLELGAHWPSDVIAGLFLGMSWLLVVILALRRAEATNARLKKSGTIAPNKN